MAGGVCSREPLPLTPFVEGGIFCSMCAPLYQSLLGMAHSATPNRWLLTAPAASETYLFKNTTDLPDAGNIRWGCRAYYVVTTNWHMGCLPILIET